MAIERLTTTGNPSNLRVEHFWIGWWITPKIYVYTFHVLQFQGRHHRKLIDRLEWIGRIILLNWYKGVGRRKQSTLLLPRRWPVAKTSSSTAVDLIFNNIYFFFFFKILELFQPRWKISKSNRIGIICQTIKSLSSSHAD